MCYILNDFIFYNKNDVSQYSYLYALAVDKSYRGLGISRELCRAAIDFSKHSGSLFISTMPAKDWLYAYYDKYIGTIYHIYRKRITLNTFPELTMHFNRASAEKYHAVRNELLSGSDHIDCSDLGFEYEKCICESESGNLMASACAVFSYIYSNGTVFIRDFVCQTEMQEFIASQIGAFLNAKELVYYRCDSIGEPYMVFSCQIGSDVSLGDLTFS